MADAWYNTPTKWYPLPVGVGALLLAAVQYKKERQRRMAPEVITDGHGEVVKLKGPWQVRSSAMLLCSTILKLDL